MVTKRSPKELYRIGQRINSVEISSYKKDPVAFTHEGIVIFVQGQDGLEIGDNVDVTITGVAEKCIFAIVVRPPEQVPED